MGTKVINNQVVIDEEFAKIDNRAADIRTAETVQELANNICDFIKVTVDYPSKHDTGFMPLLDLQVKMENKKVQYVFTRKQLQTNV